MLSHVLYLIHSNQHSQHPKNYKNENLGSKMEVDTTFNCSRFKRLTNRVEYNSNTVAEELFSSENVAG